MGKSNVLHTDDYDDFIAYYSPVTNYDFLANIFEGIDIPSEKEIAASNESSNYHLAKFMRKNFKKMNKERYIFYVLYSIYFTRDLTDKMLKDADYYNEEKGARKKLKAKNLEELEERCKKVISHFDYSHYRAEIIEETNDLKVMRVSAKDLLGKTEYVNDKLEERKIKKIEENFDIKQLLDEDSLTEMDQFIKNKSLRTAIKTLLKLNTYAKRGKSERERLRREFTIYRPGDDLDDFPVDWLTNYISKAMGAFTIDVDYDKFLLFAASKIKKKLEIEGLEEADNQKYADFLLKISAILKENKSKSTYVILKDNKKYGVQDVEADCKRITKNGYYVSSKEEQEIRDDFENITKKAPEKVGVLEFNEEEINQIMKQENGIAFLIKSRILSKKAILELAVTGKLTEEMYNSLMQSGLLDEEIKQKYLENSQKIDNNVASSLSNEEKIKYFLDNKIDYEFFTQMDDEQKEEFSKALSIDEFTSLYKGGEKSKEKTIKYGYLLKTFCLDRKDEIEKYKFSESIMDKFIENDCSEENDFLELYNMNLIGIKNVLEICDDSFVISLIKSQKIRKDDIKTIAVEEEKYKIFYSIFHDSEVSFQSKISVLRMAFSNIDMKNMPKEKVERIKKFQASSLNIINMGTAAIQYTEGKEKDGKIGPDTVPSGSHKKAGNKYVSEPQKRWDFFDTLGDYQMEILKGGTGIFKFPNLNGGTIIIEQLFDKNKPYYGKKTQIIQMPIPKFEQIEENIIVEDSVPARLEQKYPKIFEGVKMASFVHGKSWGQAIAEYFDYKADPTRSKENIDDIDRLIKEVLDSRTKI